MIKAFFFDMDGVLVLSEPAHYFAWQRVWEEIGANKELFSLDELWGRSDDWISKKTALVLKDEKHNEEELFERKARSFEKILEEGLPSLEGRNNFLAFLSQHFKLIVVSSSSRRDVNYILKREKIAHFFSTIVSFEDTLKHKPDPAPYLLALDKTGLEKDEVVVFEDSLPGIEAALNAGLSIIGVASEMTYHPSHPEIPFIKDFSKETILPILERIGCASVGDASILDQSSQKRNEAKQQ